MSSTDFELEESFSEDEVSFDEVSSKITAKESLEKRRLIDDLLAQRRLERQLKDFDYDLDDDDFDDEED
ncbi:MAG: hypothetical protein PHW49_02635 [Acinetobacter harbinensis]|uniref:PA3496 family putative envelope integrity protein n=1 Tax=Acinetobacter TaxID=469 RepID=UPI00057C44C3|nr:MULTISPECIES: hypothetical protein [Acinetobacter]KWQ04712.1 hypothetical protein SE27_05200 [Acinetobacter harbinensis]MBR5557870.1 hypothetical protein [Acinetobacter sp.]MDD2939621.1 hypothetical protein [Acinetobacter harbinensis]